MGLGKLARFVKQQYPCTPLCNAIEALVQSSRRGDSAYLCYNVSKKQFAVASELAEGFEVVFEKADAPVGFEKEEFPKCNVLILFKDAEGIRKESKKQIYDRAVSVLESRNVEYQDFVLEEATSDVWRIYSYGAMTGGFCF